ncbi:hypothetical protein PENSPDRAFT_274656 [Peniophora sp. CONT]|nr:hypothetical protein PENSPDRAFT_274656 [Peniophora sp. CONT]
MIPITCNAVGDIINLASLILDVARALNDTRGSASEYRNFAGELNALHAMLTSAARIAEGSVDNALRDEIIREVDQCGRDVQRALSHIAKFSALGRDNDAGSARRVKLARHWYKLEWRFAQRNEAQAVRRELTTATQRLTTLFVISTADGATRFRTMLLRRLDALVARDATLFRIISENTAALSDLRETSRRSSDLVQELFTSVPNGVDSRTAAVAVLCAAVCAMHGPYERVIPTALLLVAICILLRSPERYRRALVQDVAYSAANAVTLLDAFGRQLILPFELCETQELFHRTLVNLFSRTNSRWFIETQRYVITLAHDYVTIDGQSWELAVKRGREVHMSIILQRIESFSSSRKCPSCWTQTVNLHFGQATWVRNILEETQCAVGTTRCGWLWSAGSGRVWKCSRRE